MAAILWENDDPKRVRLSPLSADPDNPILLETERQLGKYFAGKLKAFSVPLDFEGTEFQKSVWKALLTIPSGETRSYREIARQIGRPAAFRAVGAANGKNPNLDHRAVPPGHRIERCTDRVRGRPRDEGTPAPDRKRKGRSVTAISVSVDRVERSTRFRMTEAMEHPA